MMKHSHLIFAFLSISTLMQSFSVQASTATDFECALNDAETIYPELNQRIADTETIVIPDSDAILAGSWRFRVYADGYIIGLRNGEDIFSFQNNQLVPIGKFQDYLAGLDLNICGEPLSLTVLHINDHHSHLQADTGANLIFDEQSTRVEIGGFPRVAAKIKALETENSNIIKIHAGDAVTGTLFYTLYKGEADAVMMNNVCFDIFALGNHEFDGGDAGLKDFLDFLAVGDCGTDVLAANVIPQIGTPLALNSTTDYFQPFTIKEIEGQQVGFIGLDIASKTQNSSSPLPTTQFLDEAQTAQKYIDQLTAQGVNKIILVTHFQYKNDLELASQLTGVDAIVGGDSHSLLGDFADVGLNSAGPYPTRVTDANGDLVCVVQAWQYSLVVGELHIDFDEGGVVTRCNGVPHLLLADSFKRSPAEGGDRVELTGDERASVLATIDQNPQLSIVLADESSQALLDTFAEQTAELENTVVATVAEDLCLERIPGQGRSAICDVSVTQSHGGDIQQLVAEAFRARSFEADICIQNAGGVRIDIPTGDFTIATAYELLPFANTLVNIQLTGAEIKQTLEEAIDFATIADGSTGAYPYAAGLHFNVDMTKAMGERVSQLEVKTRTATSYVGLDMGATYTVVVNSFIAGGGDKYDTLAAVSADEAKVVDTFIDYANAFVDYVTEDLNALLTKPAADDYSTQVFINAEGVQQ